MDAPSLGRFTAQVRLQQDSAIQKYTLISLPLYLAGQLGRILGQVVGGAEAVSCLANWAGPRHI